jgi:hypothetical protein
MARETREQRLQRVHTEALTEFDAIQSTMRDERFQCLEDRRFYSIAGAQWEGNLSEQYANRPRFEVNKVALSVMRIISEYRNNRVTVDFVPKDGSTNLKLADTCDELYRADEQDSSADEAYDNAFEEAVGGGFGAWRLSNQYEDEGDPENEQQRIVFQPIFDADTSVFFDLNAKRQDKKDAQKCYVLSAMTIQAYKDRFDDDPQTWPKVVNFVQFDWSTPDVVYIAEYYVKEQVTETLRIFRSLDGEETKYTEADFDDDPDLERMLLATGSVEVRERKIKRQRVHKYLLSGGKVLEDYGLIAGSEIPIIPCYGKRWFIDNIERCQGHVRLAKDAQRLKNMQLTKLGEISAYSTVQKPIFTPEQVAGHELAWADDNVKRYPYLLVNPVTNADGGEQPMGALDYTRAPEIPPAMAALLQITEQDMQEILGNQQQAEIMQPNMSGKAVELIQNKLDMQTFIYLSNFGKAVKRCGEVWLSMAREIYVEPNRKMKAIQTTGEPRTVELARPIVNKETGAIETENDIAEAKFDVAVDVGPSTTSRRASVVRAITGMMQITQDPQTLSILGSMAMMNMEGEGLADMQQYFRKQLLKLGVIEPNEEEAAAMQAELEAMQSQPDPQAQLAESLAMEARAKAAKAEADTEAALATAEKTRAQTIEILTGVGVEGDAAMAQASGGGQAAAPSVPDERTQLELEAMRQENRIKKAKADQTDDELQMLRAERQTNEAMVAGVQAMQQAIVGLGDAAAMIQASAQQINETVGQFAEVTSQNTDKAIRALSKPKRIVREKGRITRIEVEN